MSKAKVTDICHKISKSSGLSFNIVMVYFFLESVLFRLAKSEYREFFVFKGGFLLSNIVGIKTRSTVDIDFLLRNLEFSERQIITILKDALKKDVKSEIDYEISRIDLIKEENRYGGFRVKILCRLENIRQTVSLDIATGDVVTPHAMDYRYVSLFGDENIQIQSYPIETILAEKLQTIYSRGVFNSRSKDFYDLHILYKLKNNEINDDLLKVACMRTFGYRKTAFDIPKIIELFELLKKDEVFKQRWMAYSKKNSYIQGILFEDVIDSGIHLLEQIA